MLSKIILVWFLFILSQVGFSQEDQDKGFSESGSSIFNSKEKIANFLSDNYKNNKGISISDLAQQDGVQIKQIGDYNSVKANLKSDNIAVAISQKGNGNEFFIDKQAPSIQQRIVQEGQNNSIRDYTSYTRYEVNLEFVQRDNNQSIQNYGTNSISKEMKVNQSGNGASVIIFNH